MVISGAGSIIIRRKEVLLIRRQNTSTFNNMWANPGGKVEDNETPPVAALRELKEELFLEGRIRRKISDYHDYNGSELIGFILVF
ncbi:MAG TPA: NUDIX domain-containing protein [Candidatus Nanoarchaeia archaeon]|nr:NUDIX domain-containing protein [Candidatus Nanoarchaeia archaeon]